MLARGEIAAGCVTKELAFEIHHGLPCRIWGCADRVNSLPVGGLWLQGSLQRSFCGGKDVGDGAPADRQAEHFGHQP